MSILQKNTSKIAIASDLWTSKNSVYAFAGVVAYWIDKDWDLNECVLELLPLSGDHSGKASGKLIHKALQERGIATKLSMSNCIHKLLANAHILAKTGAHGTDNASSNGTLNQTLSACLWKHSRYHINAKNMQVGCGGHVLNISCQ